MLCNITSPNSTGNLVKFTSRTLAGLAVLTLAAPAARAHTPYLLPNTFNPERPRVTLQAALTEDDYFNPDIALNVPAYAVTRPSGQQGEVKPSAMLKDVAVVEAELDESGTYRISTGNLVQRKSTVALVGGKWLIVRQPRGPRPGGEGGEGRPPAARPSGAARPAQAGPPDEDGPPNFIAPADVPAGARTMTADQVMKVETYVSKGAPTDTALKTTGEGFELKPLTHPNAIYVDQGFSFQLLVDGQPVANAPISVYRSGNIYDDRRIAVELKSDAKGAAHVAFTQPGVYLLTTRYPAARPAAGDAPPAHSYTYSLTFEVTR
jgi:hypothetical protein